MILGLSNFVTSSRNRSDDDQELVMLQFGLDPTIVRFLEVYQCDYESITGKLYIFSNTMIFTDKTWNVYFRLDFPNLLQVQKKSRKVVRQCLILKSDIGDTYFLSSLNGKRDEIYKVLQYFAMSNAQRDARLIGTIKYPSMLDDFKSHFPDFEHEHPITFYVCSKYGTLKNRYGRIYITENHLLFHQATLLIKPKRFIIPLTSILQLSKTNSAFIVPSCISVATEKKTLYFQGFTDRNASYSKMRKAWLCAIKASVTNTPNDGFCSKFRVLHEQFVSIDKSTNGVLSLEEFSIGLNLQPPVSESMYNCFDKDGKGHLTFHDFCRGMHILQWGNLEQKIEFSFYMYDRENKQFINKRDMYDMLIQTMEEGVQVNKKIDEIFNIMDLDGNGYVYFNEYKQTVLAYPELQRLLGIANDNLDSSTIGLGHTDFSMVQNMLIGIEHAVKNIVQDDYSDIYASHKLSIKDLNNKETGYTLTAYSPLVFKRIREYFEYSDMQYLSSLGVDQIVKGLLTGSWKSMKSLSNSGRSGSIFMKTHDDLLIIKSLPSSESNFFKRILENYYDFLLCNKDTLLTRIYGFYKIEFGSMSIPFVVMENIIVTEQPIHELYDLKGSTVNRSVDEEEIKPGIAMKDNNFAENNRTIGVGRRKKQKLITQIITDVTFLSSLRICDYSLLVGISDPTQTEKLSEITPRMRYQLLWANISTIIFACNTVKEDSIFTDISFYFHDNDGGN
eukprot:TRINITY_DN4416_c0_g1_i3.p1 TRINITY_DN4416_c0_g1~~TRINITY_DN4416_c0_g1_i3.p1  ORF type:complete len:729 (-),score=110.22 TRINITY_DN4416_c0_g1_i3:170-2356(-)